jgi:hypothetical protein
LVFVTCMKHLMKFSSSGPTPPTVVIHEFYHGVYNQREPFIKRYFKW